jgi:hypothetical protein
MKKNRTKRYTKYSRKNYMLLNYILSNSDKEEERILIELDISKYKLDSILESIEDGYLTVESELNFTNYSPIGKNAKK